MTIYTRLRRWLRAERAAPQAGLDAAIGEREARYRELREGMLALLFVDAKLSAHGAHARRKEHRRRMQALADEMTRCRGEIEALRWSRLDAAAELALARAS